MDDRPDNHPDHDHHADHRPGPDHQHRADRHHRPHPAQRQHDNPRRQHDNQRPQQDNQRAHDSQRPHDNRRPYDSQSADTDVPPEPGGDLGLLVSDQDLEDADDILFAHLPRVVTRQLCGCGEDYPCEQVRYARLIKAAAPRRRR
ncbi:hypothetical protein ACIG87_08240 [Micromonospora sp. NPDC051925]|uniref:hypothetical protein n=1 Tax=Micromonospora sp. NPDC051925 TaxID=3364288 RepID=UPI0037C9A857